ncbi:MAG: KR domain-containing protein, partial [bacterium]|nr:KR domain-containing protein [bacterium]
EFRPGDSLPSIEPPGSTRCVVLGETNGLGRSLARGLEELGFDVVVVKQGTAFTKVDEKKYLLDPAESNHYRMLLKELGHNPAGGDAASFPVKWVHLWGLDGETEDSPEAVERHLTVGFYSIINLAKAIGDTDFPGHAMIEVLTSGVHFVSGNETLCPAKATVLGPLKVIQQEYPNINCRNIDVLFPAGERQEAITLRHLLEELSSNSRDTEVVYRNNCRRVKDFKSLRLEETSTLPFKEQGVYLITGGLGGVGLLLAEYLAETVKARLVLTGRSAFPPKEQWEALLDRNDAGTVVDKIKRLRAMEEKGASVLVMQADAADYEQMARVFEEAGRFPGNIDGVIHSVMIGGDSLYRGVKELTPADCVLQLQPKINGLLVLEKLLQDRDIDFCMAMSSTSSILGGLGFSAYSAANTFMDALVYKHNSTGSAPWVTVNWDGWQVETSEEHAPSQGVGAPLGESLTNLAMTPAEGAEAFKRILAWKGEHQVIQSAGNLHARIRQWVMPADSTTADQEEDIGNLHSRPNLDVEYAAPNSRIEKVLAGLWGELLGYDQVGLDDNFFTLSGDSLKAVILSSKIHKELDVRVPLDVFFENPTIRRMAGFISGNVEEDDAGSQLTEKAFYPLSSAQKRVYFLHQMGEKSTRNNLPAVMVLEGNLDTGIFQRTLKDLVRRHESLRTSFTLVEGEPIQRRHPEAVMEVEMDVEVGEAYKNGKTDYEKVIRAFIRPFDIGCAPLMRVGLIRMEKDKNILVFDMHRIISDGTSLTILKHDFMDLYSGRDLPGLSFQYKEFCQWQNKLFVSPEIRKQEAFWLQVFPPGEEVPVIELPLDFKRPAQQSFEGMALGFEIGEVETAQLKQLARESGSDLYAVPAALFNIFISKLSGSEDIVVGSPEAGRTREDFQGVIGIFDNTLALRNFPAGAKRFPVFLKEVADNFREAVENHDYQYEELVNNVMPQRDLSRNPLFDVVLALRDVVTDELVGPGLTLKPYGLSERRINVDLAFNVFKMDTSIAAEVCYSTALFKKGTVERFIRYFKTVVSSVLEDPGRSLSSVEIISAKERRQVLVDFNTTEVPFPSEVTIPRLLEEGAKRAGDRVGVIGQSILSGCGELDAAAAAEFQEISYGELMGRAVRLGQVLRHKGVQPGDIVAIMVPSSIETAIGLLGIMEAGAAYLPIDPDAPAQRRAFMLKDSNVDLLLDGTGDTQKPGDWNGEILELNRLNLDAANFTGNNEPGPGNSGYEAHKRFWAVRESGHMENGPRAGEAEKDKDRTSLNGLSSKSREPISRHPADTLAYVIYTSGTTGLPKAVPVNQLGIINYSYWRLVT